MICPKEGGQPKSSSSRSWQLHEQAPRGPDSVYTGGQCQLFFEHPQQISNALSSLRQGAGVPVRFFSGFAPGPECQHNAWLKLAAKDGGEFLVSNKHSRKKELG
jgi:hypothetical protein